MAHKSLSLKLSARNQKSRGVKSELRGSASVENFMSLSSHDDELNASLDHGREQTVHANFENAEMKMVDYRNDQMSEQDVNFAYKKPRVNLYIENDQDEGGMGRQFEAEDRFSSFLLKQNLENRVDKIYTIGCFDLFHQGHVQLIKRMRELGTKVIVGVHDSRRFALTIFLDFSTTTTKISFFLF
jgi:hypothetical protein